MHNCCEHQSKLQSITQSFTFISSRNPFDCSSCASVENPEVNYARFTSLLSSSASSSACKVFATWMCTNLAVNQMKSPVANTLLVSEDSLSTSFLNNQAKTEPYNREAINNAFNLMGIAIFHRRQVRVSPDNVI